MIVPLGLQLLWLLIPVYEADHPWLYVLVHRPLWEVVFYTILLLIFGIGLKLPSPAVCFLLLLLVLGLQVCINYVLLRFVPHLMYHFYPLTVCVVTGPVLLAVYLTNYQELQIGTSLG